MQSLGKLSAAQEHRSTHQQLAYVDRADASAEARFGAGRAGDLTDATSYVDPNRLITDAPKLYVAWYLNLYT